MDFDKFNDITNQYYKSKKLNVTFSIKKPDEKLKFNYEVTYEFT